MSWIYVPELDEIEIDLQRDTSTEDRWTFHRYMYFEPSQYTDWSKGSSTSGVSYLMELKSDSNIPSAGTNLSGSLADFYMKEIYGIETLTSEEHQDKFSYALVDILYENKKASSEGEGAWGLSKSDYKPWELPVDDFLVTNVPNEVPAKIYNSPSGGTKDWPRNSARDVIYGMTMPEYTQRITWSVATVEKDYSFPSAFVNSNQVTFWDGVKYNGQTYNGGKITIEPGKGLFLPPGLKRSFYKDKHGNFIPYDLWTYEVIVNYKGHHIEYKDAGKRALKTPILSNSSPEQVSAALSSKFDVCAWYTIKPENYPSSGFIYQRAFGDFDQMMGAKTNIDDFNIKLSDTDLRRATFYGDFIQDSLPLSQGTINFDAISGTAEFDSISGFIYLQEEVKLGVDSNSNIAFRPKIIKDN